MRVDRVNINTNQSAFLLPSILVMMAIIGIVAFATINLTRTSNIAATKQSYLQIAHVASKAAMDLAKEEFELDPNYDGTPETTLLLNDIYRVTIKVDVLSTSGNVKYIQAFGYVYLPEISATSSYVRDIKGGIIREGVTVGNPQDFDPILWLDSSISTSLLSSSASNGDQTITAVYGSGSGSIVEERGSNASGTPGTLVWANDDLDMSWGGTNKGDQVIGLRFTGVTVPQGATIDQAYIQFTTDETRKAGTINLLVEGVDTDNAPAWSGNFAVSGAVKTTSNVAWDPVNWNSVGASGINERTADMSSIIQELVDRSGWNSGNAMAFSIKKVGGGNAHARRTAEKGRNGDHPQLYVSWTTGGTDVLATDGSNVAKWLDQSGLGNDATSGFGSTPTLRANQLSGQPAIEFNANGDLLSSLSSTTGSAMTAFIVMRPGGSSDNNARYLSIMNSSENNDSTNADSIIPLKRIGVTSNFENYYDNSQGEQLDGAIDNQYAIYTSRITGSPNWVERLLKNGSENYTNSIGSVNYTINQIYIGGSRSGTSGAYYTDADIAEIIIYDKALNNCDLESIEQYLSLKWGIPVASGKC